MNKEQIRGMRIGLESIGYDARLVAKVVRAVNCHEELIEALRNVLKWGECEIHNEYDGLRILKKRLSELNFVRQALAKAEGK